MKVEIKYDGAQISESAITCMYQDDPFPGGHKYELTISGAKLTRYFPNLQPGEYKNPSADMAQSVFWSVEGLLESARSVESDSSVTVFLNTVEDLSVFDQEIRMTGICSPRVAKA